MAENASQNLSERLSRPGNSVAEADLRTVPTTTPSAVTRRETRPGCRIQNLRRCTGIARAPLLRLNDGD